MVSMHKNSLLPSPPIFNFPHTGHKHDDKRSANSALATFITYEIGDFTHTASHDVQRARDMPFFFP